LAVLGEQLKRPGTKIKARGTVKASEKVRESVRVRNAQKLSRESALIKLKEKQLSQSRDETIQRVIRSENGSRIIDDELLEPDEEKQAREKSEALHQVLKNARGKRLLICIKGYPDPDNISTSLCLQWLARHYEIDSVIVHFEAISHHENRALVKKLDLDLIEYDGSFNLSGYDYYAINDAQNPDLPVKLPETTKLMVFVDHHKPLGNIEGEFIDIREDAGSTSGIYGEYLIHGPVGFSGNSAEEGKIATALMHGIRSDTDNFVTAQSIDYQASEYFTKFMDKDLLSLISRQSIPAKTMDLTQVALQRKDIRGTFMFSGVGFVREEDRDGIGQCADYLLHREGIDTVVVYGVVGNLFIDGSLRTKSHTVDPDKWLKDVFGTNEAGKYYGGGRKDKGGFQIPLGVFAKCNDRELLWILIKKTIDELFYQKIGVEESANIDGDMNAK
jgi:nanoRNase/pAp phosphatase (c-di-AMP/oligoRNAs hydrolase)